MTGEPDGRRYVVVRAGNYQSARVGRPFNAQLTAVVLDGAGRRMVGVRVTWRVTSGPAMFARGARAATSTTGTAGVATSQVVAAGDHAGSIRILATAPGARPVSYSLRVVA